MERRSISDNMYQNMAMLAAHAPAQTVSWAGQRGPSATVYRRPRFADFEGCSTLGPCILAPKQFSHAPQTCRKGLTSLLLQGLGNAGRFCVSRVLASQPWPLSRLGPAQLRAVHLPGTVCWVPTLAEDDDQGQAATARSPSMEQPRRRPYQTALEPR